VKAYDSMEELEYVNNETRKHIGLEAVAAKVLLVDGAPFHVGVVGDCPCLGRVSLAITK